ncbi:uncharacterized protein LOC110447303 [Mizuhopecten yessoensis]|uniref:uncharacterized protein LOC110447303 n=1 Tax=Mizuhopecten yessoensis TaxID=6573 RepID=UPI000B45966F|nr:uncharacterized protein LOC110447303 [Mizuhopecten yessoensis]
MASLLLSDQDPAPASQRTGVSTFEGLGETTAPLFGSQPVSVVPAAPTEGSITPEEVSGISSSGAVTVQSSASSEELAGSGLEKLPTTSSPIISHETAQSINSGRHSFPMDGASMLESATGMSDVPTSTSGPLDPNAPLLPSSFLSSLDPESIPLPSLVTEGAIGGSNLWSVQPSTRTIPTTTTTTITTIDSTGSMEGPSSSRSASAPLKMEHAQSTVNSITTCTDFSKISLGRSSRTYQDEDRNKKDPSERELLLALSDSETVSSGEEIAGDPFNYCNIAVLLKTFKPYFEIRGSAFNQWIDKLKLKELTTLKTMFKYVKEQTWKSVIIFFLCGKTQIMKKDCFGNPFERLLNFAKRDHLLEYQQYYSEVEERPPSHDIINGMIRRKLKAGKCSFQEAVDWVLSGNVSDEPRPYWLSKTTPFLAFHLYGVLENSSQLPLTLDYNGILYKLAGVIFHRSDKPSGGNDHYVVRAFDPKQEIWVYNTESDGGWEKDDGDPRTNSEHTFTLSTVVYIIAVPPESIISLSTKAQCIKPPQDI